MFNPNNRRRRTQIPANELLDRENFAPSGRRHEAKRSLSSRMGVRMGVIAVSLSAIWNFGVKPAVADQPPTPAPVGSIMNAYKQPVSGRNVTVGSGGIGQTQEVRTYDNITGETQLLVPQPGSVFNIGFDPTPLIGPSAFGTHNLRQTEDAGTAAMTEAVIENDSHELAAFSAGGGATIGTLQNVTPSRPGEQYTATLVDTEYGRGGFADEVNTGQLRFVGDVLGLLGARPDPAKNLDNLGPNVDVTVLKTKNGLWSNGLFNDQGQLNNPLGLAWDTIHHYDGSFEPNNFKADPTATVEYTTASGAHVTEETSANSSTLPAIDLPQLPALPPLPNFDQVVDQTQSSFDTFVDQSQQAGLPQDIGDQGKVIAVGIAEQAKAANDSVNQMIANANAAINNMLPH